MRSRFEKMLQEAQDLPTVVQKERMKQVFHSWKGNQNQIDDVLVIGFKV